MNSVIYSTKCIDTHTNSPYFKVTYNAKGEIILSLIIFEQAFIVTSFYIDRGYHVFTLLQISTTVIIHGTLKGTDIHGDSINILSLPFELLEKLGCMKRKHT